MRAICNLMCILPGFCRSLTVFFSDKLGVFVEILSFSEAYIFLRSNERRFARYIYNSGTSFLWLMLSRQIFIASPDILLLGYIFHMQALEQVTGTYRY